jgi:hypothetical protein
MLKPKGRETEFATAAEHLVCADIILAGHSASLVGPTMRYDVLADVNNKLIRIQVKATSGFREVPGRPGSSQTYIFYCRRAGVKKNRLIKDDEFDVLALVAMDRKQIAYVVMNKNVLQTIHLRVAGSPKNHGNKTWDNIDEYPFSRVLRELGAEL